MFYSQFVLARKGPLGRIWLAAHWEKKLTKRQIYATNVKDSVDAIVQPDVPMALRMSGHLLLGVVRIYSKKVSYLLDDCSDALVKIKMAFRPGDVDLPPESSVAKKNTITLQLDTGDLDSNLDINFEMGEEMIADEPLLDFGKYTAKKREITYTYGHGLESQPESLEETNFSLGFQQSPLGGPGSDIFDNSAEQPLRDQGGIDEGLGEAPDFWGAIGEESPGGFMPQSPGNQFQLEDGPIDPAGDFNDELDFNLGEEEPMFETPQTPRQKKFALKLDANTTLSRAARRKLIEDPQSLTNESITLVPTTKKQMERKQREIVGADQIFKQPIIQGLPPALTDLFTRNMKQKIDLPQGESSSEENLAGDVSTIGDFGDFQIPETDDFDTNLQPDPFGSPARPIQDDSEDSSDEGENSDSDPEEGVGTWDIRTQRMVKYLDKQFTEKNSDQISYNGMVSDANRKTVVGTFFELLVLKTRDFIDVEQSEPYGDIQISKTANFDVTIGAV